jgi:hypothetical protein
MIASGAGRAVLPQLLESGSIHQAAVRPIPSLRDFQEGGATIAPDELQRLLIFLVFIAGLSVKPLKDVTTLIIRAVRAGASASQFAYAADFYLASRFGDIPITCLITRRATRACAR